MGPLQALREGAGWAPATLRPSGRSAVPVKEEGFAPDLQPQGE